MGTSHNIAVKLKEARREKGWSQQELAERAGLERKTVNRIENKHYSPSIDTLVSLSNALDVSVQALLTEGV